MDMNTDFLERFLKELVFIYQMLEIKWIFPVGNIKQFAS